MARPDGGWIANYAIPRPDRARGVWSLRDSYSAQRLGLWPTVDPLWLSVNLLLHGNGANGSTTITDSSSAARTVTTSGGASISTVRSKWTSSSILCGTLSLGATPPNLIGTGDFTLEAWLFMAAGYNGSLGQSNGNFIQVGAVGGIAGGLQATFRTSGGTATATFGPAAPNTWHHVAMQRVGNIGYMFLNGVTIGSVAITGTNTWTTAAIITGATQYNAQEIRFTSASRYATTGFSVPAGAFPDR